MQKIETVPLPYVRRERRRRAWPLTELATRSGLAFNTVRKADEGSPVSLSTARKLMEVFAATPVSEVAAAIGLGETG